MHRSFLCPLLVLISRAGCSGDKRARAYAREAAEATRIVFDGRTGRRAEDVGDCIAGNPTRRLNVWDLGRQTDGNRVLINQVRHLVVRLRPQQNGTRVTVHARPGTALSELHRKAVVVCSH